MNSYTALIVDDEEHSRKLLSGYLTKYCPNIEVRETVDTVERALECICLKQPQLVFLDISLMDMNAFDLLEKIGNIQFEIVFITAYDNYAIRAIKYSAVDYLLKPISIEELILAVEKACNRIDEKSTAYHYRYLSRNLLNLHELPRIALPTLQGYLFIKTDSIIRCAAAGSYTHFFFTDREPILISKGLKEYDALLQGDTFLRVHNSHLINLTHVKEYHKGKVAYVVMSDGVSVAISVRKKDVFLKRIEHLKA